MQSDKEKIINNNELPKSIRSIVRMYPSNQVNRQHYGGLPHIGNALWSAWNSAEVQDAADAYEFYSLSTTLLIEGFEHPTVDKVRLGGGSPARLAHFNPSVENLKKAIDDRTISDYPLAAGDKRDKKAITTNLNNFYCKKIVDNNIIFTHSSTQGFTLIMEAILDYGDVVIMTAPNYGLFSFIPERTGGKVELLNLSEENGWKIDPNKLKEMIIKINKELKTDYDRNRSKYIFRKSDTPPKVTSFLNINPHNPTGVVYGEDDRDLLSSISSICNDEGVLVIDDLAYEGLEYDRNNKTLPLASLDTGFDNVVSLYTLSKSYGLAGLRSGMIIANEIIISLIRDRVFQATDSLSIVQSSSMSAIFPNSQKDIDVKEKYLSDVCSEYKKRYIFVKAIIEGVKSLNDDEKNILNYIVDQNNLNLTDSSVFEGSEDIEMVIEPESGFFILLDLSKIIGKKYNDFVVSDEKTLLQFLYTSSNIKVLTGKAFCWPNKGQLIIRTTTAFDYEELLSSYLRLKLSLRSLV